MTTAATGAGFAAASIAVCGFLLHVAPALSNAPEGAIRRATALGGLGGFVAAVVVMFLSAMIG